MKSKYILLLYKQYCESVGKQYDKFNIITDTEFIIYLSLLTKRTIDYGNYLNYLGLCLTNDTTIELNKGKYDSLGKELVTIVSPFAETLDCQNSDLVVCDNNPIVIMGTSVFTADNCDLFITHNPIVRHSISDIALLHNIGANVCIGIHGKISDKDRDIKLKMLEDCATEMYDDIGFYYDTEGDNYYSCIKSERKIKKHILTK